MGNLAGTGINEINERLSRSVSAYQPNLADNVFKRQPTIELFKEQKKTYSYGTEIKVKFRYTKGGKSGSAGGIKAFQYYDQLNQAPTDTIKTGRALWKNLAVPLTYSHEELWENNSKNQLPLVKSIVDGGESLLAEELNDECWGIQGAAADMVVEPVTSIVSGSDAGTIHGLSKASNTWMYSQEVTSVGDLATGLIAAMRSGKNLAIDNAPSKGDKINAWLMDRLTYEGFEDIHPTFLQYNSNKNVDLGFEEMIYSGTKVRFDSSLPLDAAGKHQVFGLMLKYWEMAVHTEVDFMTTKFYDKMPNQAISVAQLMLRWALINNNPRTNVRITGIDL
jgi:hypothetical protein